MKKTMILAAFAALVSLASCQKEDNIINGTDNQTSPVFTASIAGSTKTTIDLSDGKVAWEQNDEITVTDAASASAVYTIESIDETTGKATFVIKEGESAIGAGPYTATYGTEPATAQTYSATAGKLYMTAETSTNSFTFTVQCGLMKLNLTKTGESVKSIAVTSSTDATYTLTCDPAQSIATAKDFFIALPAGNYKKIEITNSSDVKATLNSTSGLTVAANHIKPVTFGESKLSFPIAGKAMRTGNVEVNWVQLWAGGPKFAEYNVGAANNSAEDYGDYYSWGGSINKDPNSNTGSSKLTGNDDTATNLWGSNWRMPTIDEFSDLLNKCTCTWTTRNDINGLLCAGKEGTVFESNSIFLPTSGYYSGRSVYQKTKRTYYWSSTPGLVSGDACYMECTFDVSMSSNYSQTRSYCMSVRAVLAE